jgi:hypothetical protein
VFVLSLIKSPNLPFNTAAQAELAVSYIMLGWWYATLVQMPLGEFANWRHWQCQQQLPGIIVLQRGAVAKLNIVAKETQSPCSSSSGSSSSMWMPGWQHVVTKTGLLMSCQHGIVVVALCCRVPGTLLLHKPKAQQAATATAAAGNTTAVAGPATAAAAAVTSQNNVVSFSGSSSSSSSKLAEQDVQQGLVATPQARQQLHVLRVGAAAPVQAGFATLQRYAELQDKGSSRYLATWHAQHCCQHWCSSAYAQDITSL